MFDIDAYREKVDPALEKALDKHRSDGLTIACDNCKSPACCKQQIRAYVPEINQIADFVRKERPDLRPKLMKWANTWLKLKKDEQADQRTMHRKNMYCPFLEGGRCSIYEIRPLVCRGHYAVMDDESVCNDERDLPLRLLDVDGIHRPLILRNNPMTIMPLGVVWRLMPKSSLGKRVWRKLEWLEKRWAEQLEAQHAALTGDFGDSPQMFATEDE